MSVEVETVEVVDDEQDILIGVAFEDVAARAYEIYLSSDGGDDLENWLRAERELHAELQAE